MIRIGKYNNLTLLRETGVGLYLGDGEDDDVLLPTKYIPKNYKIGDKLKVFIYLDKEGRKVATTKDPLLTLNGFATLKVTNITKYGAFVDWGMDKELYVPISEQRDPLFKGEKSIFTLRFDSRTEKLYGSNILERYLSNGDAEYRKGEAVDLLIYHETEIGYFAIINNRHSGMLYKNEVFKKIKEGDSLVGYIKKVREDLKIDLSIQPLGYRDSTDPNSDLILKMLDEAKGFLPLTDKSDPQEIYDLLGISKKAFKKAVGLLYKKRSIDLKDDGIELTK